MTTSFVPSPPSRAYAYAALASVCLLWGTTYLAIRISLEALPPFYLIAIRYTISGGALLMAAALFGAPFRAAASYSRPRPAAWYVSGSAMAFWRWPNSAFPADWPR